jgi:hypothetical protein
VKRPVGLDENLPTSVFGEDAVYAMELLTGFFLLGAFALVYVGLVRYPLLDMLVPAVLFVIGFVMVGLFLREGRRERQKPNLRYLAAALLPWIAAALFFANGEVDHSAEIRYPTVVVETHYGSRIGGRRLIVRSWRSNHQLETIYLSAFEPFFFQGQKITIGVKSGALGVAWISSISR